MKKFFATFMAGAIVLGMTACGAKPAETTAEPAKVEETTTETTPAETTTVETTEETTAEPEFTYGFSGHNWENFITDIQVTNINCRIVDGSEYDESLAGVPCPVWEAQADQEIVITFKSSKPLNLHLLDNTSGYAVKDGPTVRESTFVNEGDTYTLTIPANTFAAGDACFIEFHTDDYALDEDFNTISGQAVTTNFLMV